MRLLKGTGIAIIGFGLAAAIWAALAPGSLTVNGKSVTTDFIEKGGRTYVPLADVAKVLDMKVAKNGSGYTLEPVGGANQLEGLHGKIGDVIRTPEFTFEVKKVVKAQHYKRQFTDGTVDAQRPGNTIVAIVVRMKNATNKVMYLNPFGMDLTALTDEDEHTYTQYTGGWADVPAGNHQMIPGSATDFALVFEVPEKAQLKDLVYQADGMGITGHPILRISLAEGK
ncbi:MAG TPA: DUF4352 domain-containing protein [Fimbriimonadaceae bacterium]|nr:DUF4352 domain-containing protein [Fimbriimonadaceae bacterium]